MNKQENKLDLEKIIDERIKKLVPEMLKGSTFTQRKLTDTPTDNLSVVNRNYVTNNGLTRPTSSVVGQPFLDMNLATGNGKPIYWNGTGWIDATGSYV